MTPIQDHPKRFNLANELHARPFPSFAAPATAVFLAIKHEKDAAGRDRDLDLKFLLQLLDRYGAPHPQPGATHYSGRIGRHTLKWEQHTEFVTYTVFTESLGTRPFDKAEFEVFPEDWLDDAAGMRFTSALIRVEERKDDRETVAKLRDWFVGESLSVGEVLDGSAVVSTDFRIDEAGHLRFAVFASEGMGPQRLGRIVQRLCEIETYKSMSMLGFARAREMSGRMGALEASLRDTMSDISGSSEPEKTLGSLLEISAEVEAIIAQSSFRFGATAAYLAIVQQRIQVLEEARFDSFQTFGEFMMRRYEPAMRTVESTEARLRALAERSTRAGNLLQTKVDVARSAQNQALLESMDRRADMALRLQETVEGLSVVAISYYAVSLAGYLFYPLAAYAGVSKSMVTAVLTLPVMAAVWWMVRRIRARMH